MVNAWAAILTNESENDIFEITATRSSGQWVKEIRNINIIIYKHVEKSYGKNF